MTTIDIRLIRPSPNPIRKTWDEDKMQELAASIRERGVIVPIKVRPVGDEYEVVYGHRRVEAARRAGLTEVPAIVEGIDDTDALIQALIENVVREDMTQTDEGAAYVALREAGLSLNDMAQQTGKNRDWISRLIRLVGDVSYDIWAGVDRDLQVDAGVKAQHIRSSLANDVDAQRIVTRKVIDERLDREQARAVADAYKAATTPELKDAVLNTSGKLGDADRILQVAQMNIGAAGLVERNEQERRQAFEDYDRAVKDFLDAMKLFDRMLKTARDAARYGKFSPEGARFAVGRIDKLIDELETLKEALGNVG